jgi:hypothetical protein
MARPVVHPKITGRARDSPSLTSTVPGIHQVSSSASPHLNFLKMSNQIGNFPTGMIVDDFCGEPAC